MREEAHERGRGESARTDPTEDRPAPSSEDRASGRPRKRDPSDVGADHGGRGAEREGEGHQSDSHDQGNAFLALKSRADAGDAEAASRIYELLYEDMRALAARLMAGQRVGHTLGATALAHEAFLKLRDGARTWNDREHALAVLSLAMRQLLVSHARKKNSSKRTPPAPRSPIDDVIDAYAAHSTPLLEFHDQLERIYSISPQVAVVLSLHYEHGHAPEDIARMLDVSATTVRRRLEQGASWLR